MDNYGNESALSNEVEAYPAFPIGWVGNLSEVNEHVIGTEKAVAVYAEVWAEGLTDRPGQGENIIAQLGYRYTGNDIDIEDIEINTDWIWFNAQYVGDSGSNDKYTAQFVPDFTGTWEYKMRFSSNQGQEWKETETKQFNVVPSEDTEPPTPPVLQEPPVESSVVTLSWSASDDNTEVYGYEIYKSSEETGPFVKRFYNKCWGGK